MMGLVEEEGLDGAAANILSDEEITVVIISL